MTRNALSSLVLAALISLGARTAEAQQGIYFGVGGGGTIPVGDFGDFAKTGWHGLAILGYKPATSPIGLRIDGYYGENKFDVGSGKTKLAGGLANAMYEFGASKARPYLVGGIGLFNAKGSTGGGETKFAAGGGVGVAVPVGSDSRFFVEGRYVNVFTSGNSLGFIPLTVGITFGIK